MSFYVDEALAAGGEVVELAVGTGRIAIPTALAGAHMIGIDSSPGMLAVCAERAREAGVSERLDLRLGDLRRPPVDERVPLVTCPFRSYLHLRDDEERLEALRASRELLRPGGRLVFDVFTPSREDVEETHGRWIEREPGIDERADWDLTAQTLTLSVRGQQGSSTMTLWWVEPAALALAARRVRLRGARVLRLVRPPAVRRRRGQRLDRASKMIHSQIATKKFRRGLDPVTAFA